MWQDLYTRGKITVEQPGDVVFGHIRETCKQLRAELYEIDTVNYLIRAKAKTTWKTFGHKFHVILGKQDCGTVIELYYNFVGIRGGPYKDFADKFFKILARKTVLQYMIKFDVINLKISKTNRSVQKNITAQLCIKCRTSIIVALISLVALIGLSPAYAVTFTDHTGYIPSWAQSMGQSQALGVCINTEYGTADSRWCAEFSGYVVDQQKGSSENISQPQITSQLSRTMFSDSSIYDKSNHDRDSLNRFSITRPQSWVIDDTSPDDPTTLLTFWNRDGTNPAFLTISRNAPDSDPINWNSMTDQEIRNMVSNLPNKLNLDASEMSITHYSDGLKIVLVGFSTTAQGNLDKEQLTIYWFNSGLLYNIIYLSDPTDFDQYLGDAQKSVDTFYVSEKPSQFVSSSEPVPEFGPMAGVIVAVSVVGSLVMSKRFSKL